MKASDGVPMYGSLVMPPRGKVPRRRMKSPTHVVEVMRQLIGQQAVESMMVIGLSANSEVLGIYEVAKGGFTDCSVDPRVLFTALLMMGPVSAFVLCHNHPSGDPSPSAHDLALTRQLAQAGRLLCMRLADHVIVTSGEAYHSMQSEGLLEVEP